MIRHGRSIFLSLLLHTILALLLIFAYKSVVSTKEEIVEKKICIELCNVVVQKPIVPPKPALEPKKESKPIVEKPKLTPKPVVKKDIAKEVPLVMPDPEPLVEQEVVKEKKVIEEIFETNDIEKVKENPKKLQKQEVIEKKVVDLEREYLEENLAKIVQLLKENLYYPRRARQMQEEGEVIVKFILSKDASVHSLEVISSKSKILSRSAIKTIKDLSGEFPKPKADLTLHVPINYSLR